MIIVSRTDDTQADFQEGVLTDVEADAGGYLELSKGKLDDYSTDPLSNGRFVGLAGTWSYDSVNKWLKQTDSTKAQHWGVESAFAFDDYVDFEFDMQIENDPSGRIHSGAFIQTVSGEVTGYRITHLDDHWVFSKWDQGIETPLTSTYENYTPLSIGTTQHIRIIHDFNNNTGKLYVDGILNLSWADSSYVEGRPGYHTYGNVSHYDNLVANNLVKTGNRISPQLDLSTVVTVKDSSVSWTETLNGQTINIETRVSFDGGLTWTPWSTCTNGGSIPNLTPSTQVVNALLECRQNLSTADPVYSPQLETLNITVEGIGMTLFQSFNF